MSFGSAARRGPAGHPDDAACPCASGRTYGQCCGPLHRGQVAPSPERLMRSRYTAFAVGDAHYLAQTWHPRTRPDRVELDPDLRWIGLRILDAPAPGVGTRGVVEFRARWRRGSAAGEQHERSRFVRAAGRWWYVDAETEGNLEGDVAAR